MLLLRFLQLPDFRLRQLTGKGGQQCSQPPQTPAGNMAKFSGQDGLEMGMGMGLGTGLQCWPSENKREQIPPTTKNRMQCCRASCAFGGCLTVLPQTATATRILNYGQEGLAACLDPLPDCL